MTFDQEVAHLCANPTGSPGWALSPGTTECGGLLAIYEQVGIDTQSLYLFDPTTRDLVETMWGVNSDWMCSGSATGVDLTRGLTITAADAALCLSGFYGPPTGGGWGFQEGCNGACPGFGAPGCSTFAPLQNQALPTETLDEALAYVCAHPEDVDGAAVTPCLFSCNGFTALAEYAGFGTTNVELFDPSTKQLAEVGSAGGSPALTCICSTSGVPAQCNVPQTVGCTNPCGDAGTSPIDASSE